MRTLFILIALSATFLCSNCCFSQNTVGTFFVSKNDGSAAKSIDDCDYFIQKIKRSDTEFVCRYYAKNGPMFKQESYRDDLLTIPNGRFCWYDEKGNIDSAGIVINGRKDKRWDYFLNDSLRVTYYDEYDNGRYIKRGVPESKTDSAGQKDTSQHEAVFKTNWNRFLEKNLVIPLRTQQVYGNGRYAVTVCFLINEAGKVDDVYLYHSVEWAADASVFQLFDKAPLWQPATENGKNVSYLQLQNIVFRYQ